VEHIEELHNLLYRIRRPSLLAIPKCGIGDKNLLGRVNKDEPIIEFHPGDLLIGENMPIKFGLLDIQKGKLPFDRPALKCSLFTRNSHLFSSLSVA
jgi:hypothetical protein